MTMRKSNKENLPAIALMSAAQRLSGDDWETLGENIDDTTITTTVKAKLAAEKGTTLTRIQVDTNRGVVQLSAWSNRQPACSRRTDRPRRRRCQRRRQ